VTAARTLVIATGVATTAPNNSSFIFSHRPCCVRRDGTLPNTCGTLLEPAACGADPTCAAM
jgi:hypothetical protein